MKIPAFIKTAIDAISRFRPGKRLAKRFGYSTLFSILFSFFLFLSLPLNRFVPNIENILSNAFGRTVRIGDIQTTFTGAIVLSDLEIGLGRNRESEEEDADEGDTEGETAGAAEGKAAPTYLFEELKLKVGTLAALMGDVGLDATLTGLGGQIEVSYEGSLPRKSTANEKAKDDKKSADKRAAAAKAKRRAARKRKATKNEEEAKEEEAEEDDEDAAEEDAADDSPVAFHLEAENINLKLVHDLREALPVPLIGTLNLEIDLASETPGWNAASGKIVFSIKDLLLSKKGYEAVIFGSSLAVPPLSVSSIEGEIVFENGVGKVTKMKVVSKHLDITLQGEIKLGEKLKQSKTDLYAAFKLQNAYLNQSSAIRTIIESADAFSPKAKLAHRDDGYYGFAYQGTLGEGRFTPSKEYKRDGDRKKTKSAKDKKRRRTAPKTSRTRPTVALERNMEDDDSPTPGPPNAQAGNVTPTSMPIGPNRNPTNSPFGPEPQPPVPPPVDPPVTPPPMQSPGPPLNQGHPMSTQGPGRNRGDEAENEERVEGAEAPAAEEEEPQAEEQQPEEARQSEEEEPQEQVEPSEEEEEEPQEGEGDGEEEQEEQGDEEEETKPPPKPIINPDDIY